jgi:hypothetical protein
LGSGSALANLALGLLEGLFSLHMLLSALGRAISAPFGRAAATEPANFGHVAPIGADLLAALSPGKAGLFSGEFVGRAFTMSRQTALSGDFTLFSLVHRRKSAISCSFFHGVDPFVKQL